MNREKVWLYCRIDKGGNMSEELLETHRYRLEEYAAEHGLSIMGISRDPILELPQAERSPPLYSGRRFCESDYGFRDCDSIKST